MIPNPIVGMACENMLAVYHDPPPQLSARACALPYPWSCRDAGAQS